jgi:eukaryotic-like serine/threonine-protein kinase
MSKSSTPELATGPRRTTRVGGEARSGVTPLQISSGVQYVPGDVVDGRYELKKEVGRGGMGVVWVAHSLVLKVDVALKLIRSADNTSEAASRMAREANAAARLTHAALVRVFDFGWTEEGDPFLVMEFIRGESLSDTLLRKKTIEARRAVQLLLPIADGLRMAHANNIVHRDIKPGNIIIAEEGKNRFQPKLLDFGIAKVGQSSDGKLTQQGVVLGSPEYMSPEQALGLEQVDARSDVWSLAIALYEMVTGRVPFTHQNYNALMQAIIHRDPEPMTDEDIGAGLWPIVAKALAKRPEDRWANMDEFGSALAGWLYSLDIAEDIAGNSLQAVWLRGADASALSSLPPPRASEPPPEPMTVSPPSAVAIPLGVAWRRAIAGVAVLAFGALLWMALWGSKSPAEPSNAAAPLGQEGAHPARLGAQPARGHSSSNPSAGVSPQDLPLLEDDTEKRPAKAGAPRPASGKKKARRDFGF